MFCENILPNSIFAEAIIYLHITDTMMNEQRYSYTDLKSSATRYFNQVSSLQTMELTLFFAVWDFAKWSVISDNSLKASTYQAM